MEKDEYQEQYQDTVDQLEEFGASLSRLKDDSLLDQVAIMQQVGHDYALVDRCRER